MILSFSWVFLGLLLLQLGHSSGGDFGDIGEEHDLDDLITKKFLGGENVKRDSIAAPSAILPENEFATQNFKEQSAASSSDLQSENENQLETTADKNDSSSGSGAVETDNEDEEEPDNTKRDSIITNKLHLLQEINKDDKNQKMLAKNTVRENAVRFAKIFRDGTFDVASVHPDSNVETKRNEIVKPKVAFRSRPEVFERRNVIGHHASSVEDIFKRDHIQMHKNIAKLAEKYKKSSLLKDLSKFTSDDLRDQTPNPVWKKFLRDAMTLSEGVGNDLANKRQRLLGYMLKPSNTPNNNNNGAAFMAGNRLYKKIGNIAIKPSEIQDHMKKQSLLTPPLTTTQQIQQQYSPQKPTFSVQTNMKNLPAANNRQPPLSRSYAYHTLNGVNGCLPENARCESGHDEQCCGGQSYCVNYWGSGKCVSFVPTDTSDRTNPSKMLKNLNAKSNFNAMLNQVKNELSTYVYHRKVGDVLKMPIL